ncbi:EscN/YscN/HrcN family type III secretion system ATPase [Hahella sp. CCB-MM4]|uniref:type III secretion system ATPase SctN n=1 Tax=Hahella sp. (strain CCB-MM4) TaxID=1926491 RepID=UPI000B9BABDA|nr:type III secretion system ATPase SctN [Hahella sp. CCB-MM4]OZG72678.1 EscN/YscN/HrcN family type III secretion system ATPase [Hahella sp. CCB-MM4]
MSQLSHVLSDLHSAITAVQPVRLRGRVTNVVGTIIRAIVPGAQIGELCFLESAGAPRLLAEVVGFQEKEALLTPMGDMLGVSTSTEVVTTGQSHQIAVGPHLLGRVLDGMGNPLDGKSTDFPSDLKHYPVYNDAPSPMSRRMISEPLSLGVRALDGLLTCGEGQRMGVFAAAGGGKSTLLSMLVMGADVDVIVIALIGERGREVREFIEHNLGPEGLARSVLVVSTSDRPSMERAKAAYVATTIAEYFRDQGQKVLLLMDSVTRFARAQREIGLAAGEPPTRRGFPPSVFATLPKLLERVGFNDKGSITALYTVLVEGDDMSEPIADEVRSILDGHIVLSRKLASANHYPAIDVLASTSRVMNSITSSNHRNAAGKIRELMAKYEEVELLVKIGEYQRGSDPLADEAIAKVDSIRRFLRQATDEKCEFEATLNALEQTV